MAFSVNDKVILIDDESPSEHTARTGKSFGKRNNSRPGTRVGFIDRVLAVTPVQVVCSGGFRCGIDGRELPEQAQDRMNQGLPARRCLRIPENAFPMPVGMQAKIDAVSLDPASIESFERYTNG